MSENYTSSPVLTKVVGEELDQENYDLEFQYGDESLRMEGLTPEEIVKTLDGNDIWASVEERKPNGEVYATYDALTDESIWYDEEPHDIGQGGRIVVRPAPRTKATGPERIAASD